MLFPCDESDCQSKQKKYEYECAYATGDVTMRYKECDVVAKRNRRLDYSLLPPWGRL